MRARATVSFSGPLISMAAGSVEDITDEEVLKDLLRAGFIVAEDAAKEEEGAQKADGSKRAKSKRSR